MTGSWVLRSEMWPPVMGRPGLTQGRYGNAGNLELVAPAVDDGLWVGWFNSDSHDDRTTTRSRAWSGALRFARGRRYRTADIAQLDAGPDWLEVVALSQAGEVVRHVWSPESGFLEQEVTQVGVRDVSGLVLDPAGMHHLAIVAEDGIVTVLSAGAAEHPRWSPQIREVGSSEGGVSAVWHGQHLDLLVSSEGRNIVVCDDVELDCGPATPWARLILVAGQRFILVPTENGLPSPNHANHRDIPCFPIAGSAAAASPVKLDDATALGIVIRRGNHLIYTRIHPAKGQSTRYQAEPVHAEIWDTDGAPASLHRGVT